ncbi:MAG: hypothetical protein R3E79_54950 [Caldilineaceae bacterium]
MTLGNRLKRCCFSLLVLTMTAACFGSNRPTPTAVAPTPTSAAVQPSTAATDNTTVTHTAAPETIGIIEEVTSIERYRMRITVVNEVSNRAANVQVDAAYIKAPPAEEITMQIDENGETQTVTMLLVDGLRYMRSGEMVVQTADAQMNLQELTDSTARCYAARQSLYGGRRRDGAWARNHPLPGRTGGRPHRRHGRRHF